MKLYTEVRDVRHKSMSVLLERIMDQKDRPELQDARDRFDELMDNLMEQLQHSREELLHNWTEELVARIVHENDAEPRVSVGLETLANGVIENMRYMVIPKMLETFQAKFHSDLRSNGGKESVLSATVRSHTHNSTGLEMVKRRSLDGICHNIVNPLKRKRGMARAEQTYASPSQIHPAAATQFADRRYPSPTSSSQAQEPGSNAAEDESIDDGRMSPTSTECPSPDSTTCSADSKSFRSIPTIDTPALPASVGSERGFLDDDDQASPSLAIQDLDDSLTENADRMVISYILTDQAQTPLDLAEDGTILTKIAPRFPPCETLNLSNGHVQTADRIVAPSAMEVPAQDLMSPVEDEDDSIVVDSEPPSLRRSNSAGIVVDSTGAKVTVIPGKCRTRCVMLLKLTHQSSKITSRGISSTARITRCSMYTTSHSPKKMKPISKPCRTPPALILKPTRKLSNTTQYMLRNREKSTRTEKLQAPPRFAVQRWAVPQPTEREALKLAVMTPVQSS
ncbi:hypothetical protein K461DRAFT_67683 [Myriangium duriaei CBS 260.36]|uniref:Uncharacterized protein n=1 Tax=Myriangium duriaei CBS 260.36 TaxID=1168546 RepID=A0A9P4IQ39_9PEZI|nr:hypothetical protein K461DRAFT_67683 [Myriangium duriaei CBS 260.36]